MLFHNHYTPTFLYHYFYNTSRTKQATFFTLTYQVLIDKQISFKNRHHQKHFCQENNLQMFAVLLFYLVLLIILLLLLMLQVLCCFVFKLDFFMKIRNYRFAYYYFFIYLSIKYVTCKFIIYNQK